jgi:hypothetical protein
MLTFRQKILATYFLVFVIIIVLLFPFAHGTVKDIATAAMEDRANELIDRIRDEPDDESIVQCMK